MLKVLLKKQFYESFKSTFINPKTNKARSKFDMIKTIVLTVLLIVGVLGGMFGAMAVYICGPLSTAGLSWMYYTLFGIIAVALGLFGSVFNTYAGLYLSKDNDLLLSMPIPVSTIVLSRVANVYLMGLMYSAVVFFPAVAVYQIVNGFVFSALIGSLVMLVELSVVVLVLSCLLGWVVARISLKLKGKSYVTVIVSIVFIALYYVVYFRAQQMLTDLLANAILYGEKIKGSAYILYLWGKVGTGDVWAMLECLALVVAMAGITWLILSKSFLKIVIASKNEKKNRTKVDNTKSKSIHRALLVREFSKFTSSANYMLNCGFGVLFLPAMGIFLLVKGNELVSMIFESSPSYSVFVPVIMTGIACMMASMNDTGAPSVSLEGKSLWIAQSLPVDPWKIIRAKVELQLIVTAIPMLFFFICMIIAIPMNVLEYMVCITMSLTSVVIASLFDVMLGIKMPMFSWTNEIVPIKQSWNVAIALFGAWGYTAVVVGGFFGLRLLIPSLSSVTYLALATVIVVALAVWLYLWLKKKGSRIFASL